MFATAAVFGATSLFRTTAPAFPADQAMAAVPLSRIADQRAIAPEHLSDNADGRQALASQLGLARIFRPFVSRSRAGRRPLSRNHLENTNASPRIGGMHWAARNSS